MGLNPPAALRGFSRSSLLPPFKADLPYKPELPDALPREITSRRCSSRTTAGWHSLDQAALGHCSSSHAAS